MSAVLRDRSLRGVRARFGCFLVFGAFVALPSVVAAAAQVGTRLLGVAGLAWLLAGRRLEYTRSRLLPLWSDGADAAALIVIIAAAGPAPSAGLLFGMIYFRALFPTGRRVGFSLCVYSLAFVVGGLLFPSGTTYPVGLVVSSTIAALVVGYLMYTLRDSLTNQEAALRAQHDATVRSQRFQTAVLDNLTDGVIACDAAGRLLVFNDQAGMMHRPADGDVPMEKWAEVYGLYGPDGVTPLAPEQVPLRRALAGERVSDAEVVLQAADGSSRVVLVSGQPILDEHSGCPMGAVVTLHDVTARRSVERELVHQSLHDRLTGLPNRALLLDRIEHALTRRSRHPAPLCLLFLDLDHFKNVNDTLGHADGDALLCLVAERIRGELHPDDTAARLGGDEYAILLEDTGAEEGFAVAQRLLDIVREPVQLPSRSWVVQASVGIAAADPGVVDAVTLLRNADLAMYAAKRGGRNGVRLFAQPMYDAARAQVELVSDLREALRRQEFFLLYQPLVSLRSGLIYGAEALLRWDHPRRGVVAPLDFIPAAESSGLIRELGLWVLGQACRQARAWQPGLEEHLFVVSVNLSPCQLGDPGLVHAVRQALADAQLPPAALALEVTETALQDDDGGPETVLGELHELGVTLSLDDFGTGYSSLGRLRAFPFSVVKIDKSFVAEIDECKPAVVEAALALARSLGLHAVAEGVETRSQLDALVQRGCEGAQGDLLSPPVPPQRLTDLIGAQRGDRVDGHRAELIGAPADPDLRHEAGAA